MVAVGIPKNEQTPRSADEAVSAAELERGSRSVSSQPTFLIIREPQSIVPKVIAAAQISVMLKGM